MEHQVSLFSYEKRTILALKEMFNLDEHLFQSLATVLRDLARLHSQLLKQPEQELRAGLVVILGLINHTHHLLNGGLQSLELGNGPVWSACVRGLMETFGACVMMCERPGVTPNFLVHVQAGKLRAAAERGSPGLGDDIDRLNQIVHPASGAILTTFKDFDATTSLVSITLGISPISKEDGREGTVVLTNTAVLLVNKFNEIISRQDVLQSGDTLLVKSHDLQAPNCSFNRTQ